MEYTSVKGKSTVTEKIRTGQSFLYRKNGYESMVVEIDLKEAIDGKVLKQAFHQLLPRYSYLTQQLMVNQGDFYLVPNNQPFLLRKSKTFLPLGGKEVNNHLLDVHYYGRTLFIAYHHGLCDGRGIMPFIRSLLYYYHSIAYKRVLQMPNVQLATSPVQAGEWAEPKLETANKRETELPAIHKEGYSLPEAKAQSERQSSSYHYRITIDNSSFMAFAKSIGATPAIALAILFSKSVTSCRRDNSGLPVICNLAADLRQALSPDLTSTQKNCVGSLPLPYTQDVQGDDVKAAAAYRERLAAFKQPEQLQELLQQILALSSQLDLLPSFKEKQQALTFFDTLLSDTYILSYIGQLELGDIEEYVAEVHTYTSGTRGLSIEMLATSEHFFLDIMQSFVEDQYVAAFLNLLREEEIHYTLTSAQKICLPKDHIHETLGLA